MSKEMGNAKEKARKILGQYKALSPNDCLHYHKACAMICVDAIINIFVDTGMNTTDSDDILKIKNSIQFYKDVKFEIKMYNK